MLSQSDIQAEISPVRLAGDDKAFAQLTIIGQYIPAIVFCFEEHRLQLIHLVVSGTKYPMM